MDRLLLILTLLVLPISANAETEDWYFNASLGFANKTNPTDVEQELSSAENSYATSRITIVVDMGFYWPVYDDTMLLGFVLNTTSDSVQSSYSYEVVAHDMSYFGISAIKFLGESVGQGFFVRGDLGSASADYSYYDANFIVDDGSGSAILLGIGYSLPLSGNRTRFIYSLNFINSSIDSREFNASQMMFGFMW